MRKRDDKVPKIVEIMAEFLVLNFLRSRIAKKMPRIPPRTKLSEYVKAEF
jgi:hypothetical protein